MSDRRVESRLRALAAGGRLDLPHPGTGRTQERLFQLRDLATIEDLSVARLAEAHCDAMAIMTEAGRHLQHGSVAGVWASKYGAAGVRATRSGRGWHVAGELKFCSGAGLLDHALVDADTNSERRQLLLVPLRAGGVEVDTSEWRAEGLRDTSTGRVRFDVVVDHDAAIGEPGFYLERPGFWYGAIGVAACWAGGAKGLCNSAATLLDRSNPYALAELGRMIAACWSMDAALALAGNDIDARETHVGMGYSLTTRHVVVTACNEIIDASVRATGPGPLAFHGEHAQRLADLRLYIEQHHHDSDLATIGREADPTHPEVRRDASASTLSG